MAAHDEGANLPLGCVVGHAQPTIVEEARECHPSGEAVGDGLGDLALPGELGALFAQPSLQRDDERTAALVTHAQAFLWGDAVDLALDGEQGVDALNRFNGNRCLVEPRQVEELAPRMCPARRLDDGTRSTTCAIEPVEAGIGVCLHEPRIACKVLFRMLPAAIRGVEEDCGGRVAAAERPIVAHIGP